MHRTILGLIAALWLSSAAQAAYFAYAPADDADNNDASEDLLVVDGVYASRVTQVDIPGGTSSYTVSEDGERVFLANDQGISLLDASRNIIVRTFNLNGSPQVGRIKAQLLTPERERLYLSTDAGLIILEGDPEALTYQISQTLNPGGASGTGLALSPDGQRLLLSGNQKIAWVNPLSGELVTTLEIGEPVGQVLFHPQDASRAYLLLPESRQLASLNLQNDSIELRHRFALGDNADPRNLVAAPDGTLYIADRGVEDFSQQNNVSGAVLRVDLDTAGLPRSKEIIDVLGSLGELGYNGFPPNHFPLDLGLSPDGSRLFVIQNVWPSQDAGVYLSIFDYDGSRWNELGRVRIGYSAYAVGDLVGPECSTCPRGYQPKRPEPYSRPAALGPAVLLALLPLAALARRRRTG